LGSKANSWTVGELQRSRKKEQAHHSEVCWGNVIRVLSLFGPRKKKTILKGGTPQKRAPTKSNKKEVLSDEKGGQEPPKTDSKKGKSGTEGKSTFGIHKIGQKNHSAGMLEATGEERPSKGRLR